MEVVGEDAGPFVLKLHTCVLAAAKTASCVDHGTVFVAIKQNRE